MRTPFLLILLVGLFEAAPVFSRDSSSLSAPLDVSVAVRSSLRALDGLSGPRPLRKGVTSTSEHKSPVPWSTQIGFPDNTQCDKMPQTIPCNSKQIKQSPRLEANTVEHPPSPFALKKSQLLLDVPLAHREAHISLAVSPAHRKAHMSLAVSPAHRKAQMSLQGPPAHEKVVAKALYGFTHSELNHRANSFVPHASAVSRQANFEPHSNENVLKMVDSLLAQHSSLGSSGQSVDAKETQDSIESEAIDLSEAAQNLFESEAVNFSDSMNKKRSSWLENYQAYRDEQAIGDRNLRNLQFTEDMVVDEFFPGSFEPIGTKIQSHKA